MVCEGRQFEQLVRDVLIVGYIFLAAQTAVLEQTTGAVAERLFYISDIITS